MRYNPNAQKPPRDWRPASLVASAISVFIFVGGLCLGLYAPPVSSGGEINIGRGLLAGLTFVIMAICLFVNIISFIVTLIANLKAHRHDSWQYLCFALCAIFTLSPVIFSWIQSAMPPAHPFWHTEYAIFYPDACEERTDLIFSNRYHRSAMPHDTAEFACEISAYYDEHQAWPDESQITAIANSLGLLNDNKYHLAFNNSAHPNSTDFIIHNDRICNGNAPGVATYSDGHKKRDTTMIILSPFYTSTDGHEYQRTCIQIHR